MQQVSARAATGVGALRIGLGLALAGAPRSFLRRERDADALGSSTLLLTRTVGVRDVALGLGTTLAARGVSRGDLRRWVAVGLVSDMLDVVAASLHVRADEKRFLVSALIPIPVIATDVWLLARLTERAPQ